MNAPADRFSLWRLCPCPECEGKGHLVRPGEWKLERFKCPDCRGEGKVRQELATCASPEAVGVALVTLAREAEFSECPIGLLDSEAGEESAVGKWLVKPWTASPRNVSDAAKLLRKQR